MSDLDNFDLDLDLDNAKEELEEVKTSLNQLEKNQKNPKKSYKKSLVKVVKALKKVREPKYEFVPFGDVWDDSGILEYYKGKPIPPPFAKGGRYRKKKRKTRRKQ